MDFDPEASELDMFVQRPIQPIDPRNSRNAAFSRCCGICCYFVLIVPLIIGLMISAEYDPTSSSCGDPSKYLFPIDLWLYIACGIPMFILFVYFGMSIYQTFVSYEFYLRIMRFYRSKYHIWFNILSTVFWSFWGCLGIYIYAAEMTLQCQQTAIGSMILTMSVFELLHGCCIGCLIYAVIRFIVQINQRMNLQRQQYVNEYNQDQQQQMQERQRINVNANIPDEDKKFKPFEGAAHHIDF